MDNKLLSDVALKQKNPSLVLKNANIVNVFTKTIEKGDLAIEDGVIIGVGKYNGKEEIDCTGQYISPGFFDSHVHIESSMLVPEQFAKLVLPKGTTSVIADPHEITNVCGFNGLDFMLDSAKRSHLSVYMMMPSCVPATTFETNHETLDAQKIANYPRLNEIFGLGEVMDYPGVINANKNVFDKIELFRHRIKDGHAPFVYGKYLDAYLLSGIKTDHESSTKKEMIEKVKKGMVVMLREGSATRNVADLAPFVEEAFASRLLFCTDDKHPWDILKEGHINYNINLAIEKGMNPITAITLATINPATHYHLHQVGAIAPGYVADIVVFSDLYHIEPSLVFKNGNLVAKNNCYLYETTLYRSNLVENTVHIDEKAIDLRLKLKSEFVYTIGFQENNVTTSKQIQRVKVENGYYVQEKKSFIRKIAVVERHHQSGRVGLGLIEGYLLNGGAIALSIAHDSHNIICIGDNDFDMFLAIQEINRVQGGITLIKNGKVFETLTLEVAGLMTYQKPELVKKTLEKMEKEIRLMGVSHKIKDPFLNLAFLSLPVIPSLKLTDYGLFDVDAFQLIPLEAGEKS